MTEGDERIEPVEELCLAGACNRGICYIGSFKKLEDENMLDLKKIVGVSIGAFVASCYLIGYTVDEMLDIIVKKNTKDFQDISLTETNGAVLKGDGYRGWIHEVISEKVKADITLKELYELTKVEFIMTSTCIYAGGDDFQEGICYFSHEKTPDIPLITAVNASMCFPFVFPPIVYHLNEKEYHFIDGGVLDNFPLDQVSDKALALRVAHQRSDGYTSTKSPISYVGKLFELISGRLKSLNPGTTDNIVCISCDDFSIIEFEMSLDDKITLYKRGYNAITQWIKSKNKASEEPKVSEDSLPDDPEESD